MNVIVEKLAKQALLLSPADRDELVETILSNAEPDPQWLNEWIDECERRRENVLTGRSKLISDEEAFHRMDLAARPNQ